MFEIEQKYHVDDRESLMERLQAAGALMVSTQQNDDAYYNHPCRDFAQTGEALRVRRVDGVPLVTYKGKKRSGDVKAREELEWRLDPGDVDGQAMERLLTHLGFVKVTTVSKCRQTYHLGSNNDYLTITIDHVPALQVAGRGGLFAEVECVLASDAPTDAEIRVARARVTDTAATLGLTQSESRSYLRMVLET
ncbi:class IV adenylate cyclase [Allorhodopirellula heiligendammensis]|uniref:CYTH domain protein n=1 Tax=Allorhodopirellula heiligendammensis TaxID=2714739 RepID=A0A5C6BG29_9BACT|nr:class IV adenylate cyclase [Allorhodopirellula heiligendammensis]TWU10642.1 CYTH domain protein [Allorhodopirellula heiligendammensis]